MKEEANQIFRATIIVYGGNKLLVGRSYTLKFRATKKKEYCELDAKLLLAHQNTLSSTKPKEVRFSSYHTVEESGLFLESYTFEVRDYENKKVAKGTVDEILLIN